MISIVSEISLFKNKSEKIGFKLAFSLNQTSFKKNLISTRAEKSALSFDISHDAVALVVLEIFHKL